MSRNAEQLETRQKAGYVLPAAAPIALAPKPVLPHLPPSLPGCLLCCPRQTPRPRGEVQCPGGWQTRRLQQSNSEVLSALNAETASLLTRNKSNAWSCNISRICMIAA